MLGPCPFAEREASCDAFERKKSANLRDEITACGQAEHAVLRAVQGKRQYITVVRPYLLFVTTCVSYKLASPTLADLTRAKQALRYLKGTRHVDL